MKQTATVLCLLCFLLGFASATIYGLSPYVELIKLDPLSAETSVIGKPLAHEAQAQELSSIDEKNKIYYFIGYNLTSQVTSLIGLDLTTGNMRFSVPLPFSQSVFVGIGQTCNVNPFTGEVYVSGHDQEDLKNHKVYKVNPKSGAITAILTIGNDDVLGGASGYDPKNNMLWLQFGSDSGADMFYGIDVNTGKIVHQLADDLNLETMDFDPVTGLMWGIGLKVNSESNYTRILITLDSKTGKMNIVSEIPGYFIIQGGMGALDYKNRLVYGFLQPIGAPTLPFEFVGIDMKSGKVITHPKVTGNRPWSVEFGMN